MAKNKTFKRQTEATRLLKKIGATRRKSRRAGITVLEVDNLLKLQML